MDDFITDYTELDSLENDNVNGENNSENKSPDNVKPDNHNEKKQVNKFFEFLKTCGVYLFFCFLIIFLGIFLWKYFLGDIFISSEGIYKAYFYIFLIFTIGAFVLPIYIVALFNKFKNNEEKERKNFFSDSITNDNYKKTIWAVYKSTFFNDNLGIRNKTRASADLYFNYESVIGSMTTLPLLLWFRLISGSFLGLGILGTFIGFSVGFSSIEFHTQSVEKMLQGISDLINNGLTTAFNTSIVGITISLLYNIVIYNPLIKKLSCFFEKFSDELDKEYYISETEALMQYTMITDENCEKITFSQSLDFIIKNMNKQTEALNNFNTDLADKISNIQSDLTQKLDSFESKLVTDVGGELKTALIENINDEIYTLKNTLIDGTNNLKEVLVKINDTPAIIDRANSSLQEYLEKTKNSFAELLEESRMQNKEILQDIVDTIKKELTDNFEKFENSFTSAMTSAENISGILENIPGPLSEVSKQFGGIIKEYENIADKLSNSINEISIMEKKVAELVAVAKIHEDNSGKNLESVIAETNKMLEGFKQVDINLSSIFEQIGEEIIKYNQNVGTTLDSYLTSFAEGSTNFAGHIKNSLEDFDSTISSLHTEISEIKEISSEFGKNIKRLRIQLKKIIKEFKDIPVENDSSEVDNNEN